MTSYDADVVISGGGPVGLMLAIELRLCGVAATVLERLPEISQIPKGNGLFGQIVPVLDYRGLLEPLRAGTTYAGPARGFPFGPLHLDLAGLGGSPLDILAIPQRKLELRLGQRLAELGGTVTRGHEVTGIGQDDEAVTLDVRGQDGEYRLRAGYLVGCDGARSLVRKQAGIAFPGITSDEIARIGRVRIPAELINPVTHVVQVPGAGALQPMQTVRTTAGAYSIGPLAWLDPDAPAGAYIVSTREDGAAAGPADDGQAAGGRAEGGPLTLAELQASFRRVLGAELPMTDPVWLTKTVGNSRQADQYLRGRILLAGDAAHIFGLGGSLNAGMLDAVNLGWKLAAQIGGAAPGGLLASYHAERHAAGHRALLQSRAQRALSAGGEVSAALREVVGELLRYPEVRRHLAELIQGSDVRYDMAPAGGQPGAGPDGSHHGGPDGPGTGHVLTGKLAPQPRLATAAGRARLAELMRTARPVLLDYTSDGRVAAAAASWSGHVPALIAQPLTGAAPADALLIRPDCYVAWASGPAAADPAAGLAVALRTWFGGGA